MEEFPERARSYRFNHIRSIAEKAKEYTESHKIDELYEFSEVGKTRDGRNG